MTPIVITALTGCFVYGGMTICPENLLETNSAPEPIYQTYTVKMSGYNADPYQTDDTPNITSIGAKTSEVIAARSRDLADELPYGTVIAVMPATTTPNCGFKYVEDKVSLRVIGDVMNVRHSNWIDLFFEDDKIPAQNGKLRNPAKAFGMCHNVEIAVVGKIDVMTDGKIDWSKVKQIPKTQSELALAVGLEKLVSAK